MSTEVTPESLRTHGKWMRDRDRLTTAAALDYEAKNLECESRPLPTVPGWYPGIVVEGGGESCTGALRDTSGDWYTPDFAVNEASPGVTIRWAEQDGKTPGQTLWEAENDEALWERMSSQVHEMWERMAAAVIAAHGTPTLTEEERSVAYSDGGVAGRKASKITVREYGPSGRLLADPRPDGAHE